MPLYETRCDSCGCLSEHLLSVGEAPPSCSCGDSEPRILVSAWALTPSRWGDSHSYYSSTLGHVSTSQDRDRKLKSKGLVHLDEVGRDRADSLLDRRRREDAAIDKYAESFTKHREAGAGFAQAAVAAKGEADALR